MAEVEYPANLEIEGPWLVDRAALDELDQIIEREFSVLVKRNEDELKKEVQHFIEKRKAIELDEAKLERRARDEEKSLRERWDYRRERRVSVDIGHVTVNGNSVAEAAKHPVLANATPRGLWARFEVGYTECELSLGRWDRASARLEVRCSDAGTRNSLFGAMRQWVEKAAPPKWQQLWYRVGAVPLWLGFSFIAPVFFVVINALSSQGGNPYRQEAHDLLRHGLSPDKQSKAIELLLALVSDYRPTSEKVTVPIWSYIFLFGALLVCIALSIGPKVIVGLGRGESRIRSWRRWFSILFWGIPAWIVSVVAGNLLARLL